MGNDLIVLDRKARRELEQLLTDACPGVRKEATI